MNVAQREREQETSVANREKLCGAFNKFPDFLYRHLKFL